VRVHATLETMKSTDGTLFTAESSSAWVYYVREIETSRAVDRTIAFVPRADNGLPLTLALAASWQIEGVYVFLGRPTSNDARFLERCRRWLATDAPAGAAFVWLPDPEADVGSWAPSVVRLKKRTAERAALATETRIRLRNYALVLPKGLTVGPDPGAAGFRIGMSPSAARVRFEANDGQAVYDAGDGGAFLGLRGGERSALACDIQLPAPAPGDVQPFEHLDACIRYFYPAPSESEPERVESLRFPVFDTRGRALAMHVTVDPNDPLGPRSALAFANDSEPLPTYFRTTTADVVRLRPAGCRLRFGVCPESTRDPSAGRYYLMPSGPCEVAVDAASPPGSLQCGVSAAESIELGATGVVLAFVEGCPAYAPYFAPGGVLPAGTPEDAPRLSDTARTSWISIGTVATALGYFAQPERSLLYARPDASSAPEGTTLLSFFPVRAADLPPLDSATLESTAIAPLVPYAGCGAATTRAVMAFEIEVLSQERRDCLVSVPVAPVPGEVRVRAMRRTTAAPAVRAMTPAGWIATFAEDRDWQSLELARVGDQVLALHDIGDPLRSALLANQQFVVISDPHAVRSHLAAASALEIDGWRFDFAPDRWHEHGTLMILKRCDRPLADLARDVASWTMPDSFNSDPARAQRDLLAIIDDARRQLGAGTAGGPQPDHAHFVHTVVDDPRWHGVLFLRVALGPLPADLEALRPGLDTRLLCAHHVGVDQSHVRAEGASLVQERSSVFGLVRYAEALRADLAAAAYGFQVLDLRVELANSTVSTFASRIALGVRRLFGAPATGTDPEFGSALVLTGLCQRRESSVAYVFQNERSNTFDLRDALLRAVTITRAEMTSLPAPGDAGGARTVRFALWGTLAFRPLASFAGETCDLFGFDALGFSGLTVSMTYAATSPRAAAFALDVTSVTLDPLPTRARAGSLPRHFPVTPRALIGSAAASDPSALGFMPVQLPAVDTQKLSAEWFGILLDLDLGTPGALSSIVNLTATLGLFWSPDVGAQRVLTGLRLPGSVGGRNELSLMGVLKLSIYSTQLLQTDRAFLLKLTGVTLTLMGQSLPPAGSFDFFVFGDPDPQSRSTSLGWYGAYRKPQPPKPQEPEVFASRHYAARQLLQSPSRRTRTAARRSSRRATARRRHR
jgi:hypothetical protein